MYQCRIASIKAALWLVEIDNEPIKYFKSSHEFGSKLTQIIRARRIKNIEKL